ncbi:ABC transporter permease [Streptomyces actuosus]|uniref:ABC transporter permease n=1 Tax=Streptomyces actuosus TaxID=1885 RepID=A0ABS2VNS0_STRAS|nr:FtsX-like permease family protein [Streptomyces actuosus]MBN0044738.1 ABC transporter permease [Streptomyces actuosus]
MRHIMFTKTRRDLRRRLSQFTAVAITVMLGVTLFIASYDAYLNLSASYERTYSRLHFADLTATAPDARPLAARAEDLSGVAAVTTRTQADVPLDITGQKLQGRVVGLPDDAEAPAVNQVEITAGRTPAAGDSNGAVLEQHAARTFGLRPGDTVRAYDGSGWRTLTVRGIAVSPEYLWPARDRQEVLADPHSFAVLYVPETTARALAGTSAPNQALVRFTPDTGDKDGTRATSALRAAGAVHVQPRADQPSNSALGEDLKGFSELAVAFPLLFLSAAGVAAYILITRLVLAERRIIGTLLAAGAHRGAVVRHYLAHAVIATTAGAVAGVVLGAVATSAVTRAYTSALDIPDTVVGRHVPTSLLGLLFGLVVGLVAGGAPALAAARTAPAEAMRGDGSRTPRPGPIARLLARARRLPVGWRMALRDLGRSRRRTVATMSGAVLALVLVLTSVGMLTSMRAMISRQFDQVQRQDATVTAAAGTEDLAARLRAAQGVTSVEPSVTLPVTVSSAHGSYSTSLTGYRPDTQMHRFLRADGVAQQLPAHGVLAGAALADRLDVSTGDRITLTGPDGRARQVTLAGFVHEPMGTVLYGSVDTVRTVTGAQPDTYLLRFADGADRAHLRTQITGLDGVVAYTDAQALRDQVDRYLNLFWIFIGAMLVLGGALAFTVIYVTMTVNVAERTGELATLRAAGVPLRRVAGVLATENLTATLLAVPAGLAAGAATAWAFLQSFNSDLFTMQLSLGWPALLLAAVSVVAAAAVSQLPALRAVGRLDIARVVRERAQ